jgi:tetratricopeptide (TPR) repeat protein
MDAKKYTQRLLQVLAEERASHGHGAAADIDQQLQRSEGYLGRVLRGEVGLQVEMLFNILQVLGSDPADFFARVAGSPEVDPKKLLARLMRQNAPAENPLLERVESLMSVRLEDHEAGDDLTNLQRRLSRIDDDLRFSDPSEATKQAKKLMKEALALTESSPTLPRIEILCDALGVSASIDRVRARFTSAAHALHLALRLAHHYGLRSSHALLLERTCYLIGDQGEYQTAVELAKQANDHYVLLSKKNGIGKTLVDRGVMLFRLGNFQEAIQAFSSSLKFLPEDSWRNRTAALQGLGASHLVLGNLHLASVWTSKALKAQQLRTGQSWWRLIWLQGEIALKRNLLGEAEHAFSQVHHAFTTRDNPFDIAVISLRLAKTRFLQGRIPEVRKLAAEMLGLLKPLRGHKIASAVIQEFACAVLTGEITEVLLDNAFDKIEKESGSPSRKRKFSAAIISGHTDHSVIP